MGEIPARKFAGAILVLVPIIFWITTYLRFDCQEGGSCSMPFNWLIIGFGSIIFGLVVLLSLKTEEEKEEISDASTKKKM